MDQKNRVGSFPVLDNTDDYSRR